MKNKAQTFTLSLLTPYVYIKNCEIVDITKIGATIKYKKPRSSKYTVHLIPINSILSIEGEIGSLGSIYFIDNKYQEYDSVQEQGRIKSHFKLLKFCPSDKETPPRYFNPKYAIVSKELDKNIKKDSNSDWDDD